MEARLGSMFLQLTLLILSHSLTSHSLSQVTNWLIDNKLATIEFVRSSSGELTDAFARVDRQAVLSRSKEVMGQLLLEIQTRKSTGDREGAEKFYKKLTKPSQEWIEELRPLVLGTLCPKLAHLSHTEGKLMRRFHRSVQLRSFLGRSLFNPILESMDKGRSNWSSTLLRSRELSNHSLRGDCRGTEELSRMSLMR